jgi:hypothetical protein
MAKTTPMLHANQFIRLDRHAQIEHNQNIVGKKFCYRAAKQFIVAAEGDREVQKAAVTLLYRRTGGNTWLRIPEIQDIIKQARVESKGANNETH